MNSSSIEKTFLRREKKTLQPYTGPSKKRPAAQKRVWSCSGIRGQKPPGQRKIQWDSLNLLYPECPVILWSQQTSEREALQLGRQTQRRCEELGLVTATGILETRKSFGSLISGIVGSAMVYGE
ncbi:hypothetical protein TNIN_223841 [Trichonephila inaurata madagascariensis]|uniref:Uncharacterized protein n=1 Tax=Trichonephila inaurata madagascariensis TaxID=2747483 RepID=A0A8X6KP26_9ARAC|nr:hypothetical protein TNIN_223841 [Trichonephila inaurata madagascariensis]